MIDRISTPCGLVCQFRVDEKERQYMAPKKRMANLNPRASKRTHMNCRFSRCFMYSVTFTPLVTALLTASLSLTSDLPTSVSLRCVGRPVGITRAASSRPGLHTSALVEFRPSRAVHSTLCDVVGRRWWKHREGGLVIFGLDEFEVPHELDPPPKVPVDVTEVEQVLVAHVAVRHCHVHGVPPVSRPLLYLTSEKWLVRVKTDILPVETVREIALGKLVGCMQ